MKLNENNLDCTTFIYRISPFLVIACFLLGFFLFRNKRIKNENNNKSKKKTENNKCENPQKNIQ
jgi:large-conductance mechanosensitive channel